MELDTKRDGFVQILIEQEKKVLRQWSKSVVTFLIYTDLS